MEVTIALCTLILSAVGVQLTRFYAKHAKSLADDQMMKELFKEFNERYDLLNDDLEKINENFETLEKINALSTEEKSKYKSVIVDFFNLCAEEYYWYHYKKRIDPIVWRSWHAGMNSWYRSTPAISQMWESETSQFLTSYYITNKHEFFIKH